MRPFSSRRHLRDDLGIEIGKLLYWNRDGTVSDKVVANREKLNIHAEMIGGNRLRVDVNRGGRAGNDGYDWAAGIRLTKADLAKGKQSNDAQRRIKRSSHGEIVYQGWSSWGSTSVDILENAAILP